ncbi:amidohydrolase family protein [Mesosutterella sp. OilRF-GAM-744-9]|uniref:Amidohydrolase family protein n=1 Tax=Mesosutterella porci TaxID=2915351 RepID=A0ABS9MMX0_9BURK|nr:amidohydrolase family protein [Mesosutterella sp. oilRF-744-WT-GAM-9]MCG5029965.1 amidohydrolase family protein [Mesosutterella sp. oilRF-744-WT-GAM-9]
MLSEFRRASALLEVHPEIVSESYVSDRSGWMVSFDGNGLVASHVMRRTPARFGYGCDRREVSRAIRDHVLQLVKPDSRGSIGLVSGDEGVEWLESHPGCGCAFDRVTPFSSRVFLAAARRSDSTFLVDAISTDGGGIACNVILEQGLCIQELAGMTLAEFALKTSLLPARMLGLEGRKGHFTPGADADVTVYDPVSQKAVLTLVEGRKVLFRGTVARQPGRVICTESGRSRVEAAGLEAVVVRGGIPTLRRRP